ncbi:MAG: DUF5107 domain-containing protein [Eubacteriales bacterium]|nr:DUF5107 domain-containing protein [Eubacteriales bacterium]
MPEFGGQLWSLWDKKLSRKLLYVNSAFQPANLAIRNAWFSGGKEHNMPELSNIVDFPYSSVGDCEKQWLDLMNNKTFDEFDISDEPKGLW